MRVTIKYIAKKSGVSISTVSKIISGKYKTDNIKISAATVERVLKTAEKYNYEPDYGARLLSTGKSFTIGVYMPKLKNSRFYFSHYYSDIIDNINRSAVESGYDVLLINYGAYVQKFNTKRIDGLIIIEQNEEDSQLQYLIEQKKSFVIVNNLMDKDLGIYSINVDNYQGVKYVVDCFKQNNHKKIAFIGELKKTPQKEHIIRLNHFKSLLENEGLDIDEELFLLGDVSGISENIGDEYYDQLSGYNGMKYLMENHRQKFTGVFCANDLIALGALNYLYKTKIQVPDEVSIIGFDNIDFTEHLMGGLTTISQPLNKMGKKAFSLVLEIINEGYEGIKTYPKLIKINPEIIVRNSVKKL